MEAIGKSELCATAVVFPGKGTCEGEYREIVDTNYREGEIREFSKEKGHAKDQIRDLNIQKNILL